MAKTGKKPKKVLRPLPIVLLAAAAVALLAATAAVAASVRQPLPSTAPAPSGTVKVNDGVHTVEIRPWEDVPVSELAEEAFSAQDDLVLFNGARQGIDVSEHQGAIDWEAVADSGVSFVFVRVGGRGSTEGRIYADERFEENVSGAQAAGLQVGVYFFSQALDEREAVEEADFVAAALNGRPLELPVMFDWEPAEIADARTGSMEKDALTDCAAAFCRRMTAAGYDAGVYFNRQQGYYLYDLSQLKEYAFWVAEPESSSPSFYYAFRFWQYSFTGTVPGIGTVVDRDLMFEEGAAE